MAYYIVSKNQLTASVLTIAALLVVCIWFAHVTIEMLDMPEVYRDDQTGQCVKVVNYKNGDKFTCQDVDVSLRKYSIVKQ